MTIAARTQIRRLHKESGSTAPLFAAYSERANRKEAILNTDTLHPVQHGVDHQNFKIEADPATHLEGEVNNARAEDNEQVSNSEQADHSH